jgi:hypothetical protein
MATNAIIAVFPEDAKAYKAFSELKTNERVVSAGLVEVQAENDFELKDSFTNRDTSDWLTGSVFGAALGLIGGPLGVLFGGTLGALVGSDSDVAKTASDQVLLAFMATRLSAGDTAVLIVADEDSDWDLDSELVAAGADPVARQDLETVIKEVARAEMIAGDVDHLMNETQKAENKLAREKKIDAKVAELKARLKLK